MPLIHNDKWGRRVARIGPIAARTGKWLAIAAAALLVAALIFLR